MSRYIITILIFLLVTGTMMLGEHYISENSKKLIDLTDEAEYFLESSKYDNAADTLNEISRTVKTDMKVLMMLVDHDVLEKLSVKFNRAKSYTKSKEKSLAAAELTEARDIIEAISKSQKLTAENIL